MNKVAFHKVLALALFLLAVDGKNVGIFSALENKQESEDTAFADACTVNPCKNGGTCKLFEEKPICICRPWYLGDFCETNLCSPNPCQNNGTCEVVEGEVMCSCQDPFTGDRCEKDPRNPTTISDYNTSSSEEFNTTTSKTFLSSRREANFTFDWVSTTVIPDICSHHDCMNRGICVIENYRPRCLCFGPFTGDFCEKDLCTENPCLNGGTCLLSGSTFKCICKETFSGNNCESDGTNTPFILQLAILSVLIFTFIIHMSCLVFRRNRSNV